MRYQTHWRLAFLVAFFFHIVAWLFLMVLIPDVFKHIEQPPPDEPMEWVELADDDGPPE
ncbi:MAG: sodium pump decarboxylase, partial [Selenomonas sp.]|nr:sodium pump decarboxylase [Selenomonas sp.]